MIPRLYTPTVFILLLPNLTFSTWFCHEDCKAEISEGPSCHTESHGTLCLRERDCAEMSKQHKLFEKVLCQSQYLTEFENKTDCWGIMFENCYKIAVISSDANRCTGKISLLSHCKFFFKDQPPFCSVPVRYLLYLLLQQECPIEDHPDSVLLTQKLSGCSHYCGREISEGPQCSRDISDGVQCLTECEDPFLQNLGLQLQRFEETACKKGLEKDIDDNYLCWTELFNHCKDLAVPKKTVDYKFCKSQEFLLHSCKKRMSTSHPSCNRMTNMILRQLLVDLQDNQCEKLLASSSERLLHNLSLVVMNLIMAITVMMLEMQ